MSASTWRIFAIDTGGADLALTQLVAWAAGSPVAVTSIHASFPPALGGIDDLLVDDETVCIFSPWVINRPGFYIDVNFASEVDLWGFQFAGPSPANWPLRYAVSDGSTVFDVGYRPWQSGQLSEAPTGRMDGVGVEAAWDLQTVPSVQNWMFLASEYTGTRKVAAVWGYGASTGALLRSVGDAPWSALTGSAGVAWNGVRVSDNGNVLLAVSIGLGPAVSTNGWGAYSRKTLSGASNTWYACGMSGTGSVMLVPDYGGRLWVSHNSGSSWTSVSAAGVANWYVCDVSRDGSTLLAAPLGGRPWMSSDGGATWAQVQSIPTGQWLACALSEDGRVAMVAGGDVLWLSVDQGASWHSTTPALGASWRRCAVSGDGQTLLLAANVVGGSGGVYMSFDGGQSWQAQSVGGEGAFGGAALAGDGSLAAIARGAGSILYRGDVDEVVYPRPPSAVRAPVTQLAKRGTGLLGQGFFSATTSRSVVLLDLEFGGHGCLYGTVELYAQSGNILLPRRVRLHRSRDGLLVRETWSDAQGNYRFDGISERYTYDVIAWDHEGLQQSVVANDLTPEVMP